MVGEKVAGRSNEGGGDRDTQVHKYDGKEDLQASEVTMALGYLEK